MVTDRIPRQIREFISEYVYDKQLKMVHDISSKTCCHFVNVSDGQEGERSKSWINKKEIQAVVKIAKIMQDRGKSFKRSAIENVLKDAMLSWKDKCYNVDSFQDMLYTVIRNEDDYIIVSIVQSKKLGFLVNEHHVNVILTRCKKGMIICSSHAFLEGIGSRSLVGRLAVQMGTRSWVEYYEVLNGRFPTI
ncbi:uncharacterized protein EV420DRAFT_1728035 [Desarmillaria tabescens]|uniref:DNA2/NAM7 helicase-like C-terminal domain-containing protein n=1 Tax=Armillaria tabescens TaxID=1929756 RepID=A0AA39NDC9_ARMTA|nr:uncharacterized protein EV420DRAFT_1728035 [Desarmillaria tabescens]KAK0463444.1 hypothetical protein EV420DRAFT_1728035 [Desarmillaria tabescens]